MRTALILLTVLTFFTLQLNGQTRTIRGRIISEDLEVLPKVSIQNEGNLLIGETDFEGRFDIEITHNTKTIKLGYVGFEPTTIKLNNECNTVEIVMMNDGTYDFMSPRKIDRQRLKQFNGLSELHLKAYKNGLFSTVAGCYIRPFEPVKPYFDERKKERKKMDILTKQTFERLKIGDTIKIPYHGQYRSNEGDKLYVYSNLTDNVKYDCIVEGKIISKNKFKKGYNLVYKVTNFDICKSPTEYRGKPLEIGDVFTHNMRNFKILSE